MEFRPGDRIDRYTLVRPLGEGGQGAVWQVVDPLDRGATRALKLVRLSEAGQAAFARARREAKILSTLAHPGLCACHALFEDLEKGLVGVVLDLVQGAPLDEAMQDGRMSKGHRFATLVQVADVLAYVHAAGLAHRDLKPANVLVTDGFWEKPDQPGAVKLIDFGIAVPIGNPHRLTSAGGVIGTVRYLSPELFGAKRGEAAEESCARDMFAFGVIAWELLFGSHPAGLGPSASFEAMAQRYTEIRTGRRTWPSPGLEGAWGEAIAACLSLRPEDRPENGAALVAVLRTGRSPKGRRAEAISLPSRTETHLPAAGRSLPSTEPMPSPGVSPPARKERPAGRSARGPMYALAGAIALLAGAIYLKPPGKPGEEDALIPLPSPPSASAVRLAPIDAPVHPSAGVCCGGKDCRPPEKNVKGSSCEGRSDQCMTCGHADRSYIPGKCADQLPQDRIFKLRLARIEDAPEGSRVCVRRGDDGSPPLCLWKHEGSDQVKWTCRTHPSRCLEVPLSALVGKPGLDITIVHENEVIAHQNPTFEPTGFKTSALCIGVKFKVGGDKKWPVSFYLDDP